MKKVYTTGVFDIMHKGHFNILREAAALGDHLVVGIQSSASAKASKGNLPILSDEERQQQLLALPFVDEVIKYEGTDQRQWYEKIKPAIVVQGDDWIYSGDRTPLIKFIKEKGIRLVLLPRTQDISTTEIKQRIYERQQTAKSK